MLARKFSAFMLVGLLTAASFVLMASPATAELGLPDGFGYRWVSSSGPGPTVTMDWIEISSSGTDSLLDGDDSFTGPFPIGFDFEFYGNVQAEFYISANGFISFGSGSYEYYNTPIPDSLEPNDIIAPYWDDLCVNYDDYNSGAVYYETVGADPERQLVVQWDQVSAMFSYALMTFQLILNETGEIWFQYLDLNGMDGTSATIGIENSDGTVGSEYSFNSPSVTDGSAVMFYLSPIGFGLDQSSTVAHGSVVDHTLTLWNHQDVTDCFDITFTSVQGWEVELVDSSYSPLTDTDLSGDVDTGDMAPGTSFTVHAMVFVPWYPSALVEVVMLNATSAADPDVYAHATLTVNVRQAMLTPFHSDSPYDADDDGDIDYLRVNVSVNAAVTGIVHLTCVLYDSIGTYLALASANEEVYAGDTNLTVQFPGEPIFREAEDGTFDVRIILYDQDWSYLEEGWYTTDSYLASDFDPPVAMFSPPHWDHAYDDDSDGLREFLVVEVSVEVFEPGEYSVQASLEDSVYYSTVALASNSAYMGPGPNTLAIMFPGGPIRDLGMDTDYWVSLALYTADDEYLESDYHATDVYAWATFEPLPVMFAPPYSDAGEDLDDDGYYDYLTVTIPVECVESGEYLIQMELFGWTYSDSVTVWDTLELEAGTTTDYVVRVIDHETVRRGYISGYYGVEMYLHNASFPVTYDYDGHSTAYYYYYDFDPIGAFFSTVWNEGVDTDSDGYYNEVVVTASIYPLDSGYFEVEAAVDDPMGYPFQRSSEVVYLSEGVEYLYEVVLDARDMRALGYSGTWYTYLYLRDAIGEHLYHSTYHSMYYYIDYLEPIGAFFAPPHSDEGVDHDSDDTFDWIEVVVNLHAQTTGYYDVEIDLFDTSWSYVDTYVFTLYMVEDAEASVKVYVDAYMIHDRSAYGRWYLYMYVSDHITGVEYDSDYYETRYYYPNEFDTPPVMFDPPHSYEGHDTDDDGLYDFLSVGAELDCYVPGTYSVTATLSDSWGYTTIATASNTKALTMGNNVVPLRFDGWVIRNSGISDTYRVELTVMDAQGRLVDTDWFYTGFYWYDSFDTPPAVIDPPHSDHAIDTDDDGLYEFLVVTVPVEAYVGGEYVLFAELRGQYGQLLEVALNETVLPVGASMVEMWFDGWLIAVGPADPYRVEVVLMSADWVEMHSDVQTLTGTYLRSEFDPTPPRVESMWAYDAPVIDGVVDQGEWADAVAVDLVLADNMNRLGATTYIMNDDTNLYILVDVPGDTTESRGDHVVLAFETDNDGVFTDGREDWFAAEGLGDLSLTYHMVYDSYYGYWVVHCAPFDESLEDHDGLAGAAGFGPSPLLASHHRAYEFSIPLALLGLSLGDTIGFAVDPGVMDAEDMRYSTWPAFFTDRYPVPEVFGDLVISEERPLTVAELSGDEGLEGWFLSDVEVTLTATGGTGGVAATYYKVDGGGWEEYSEAFTVSGDALHTVMFYSSDVSGNNETVRSVQVGIDTVAPSLTAAVMGAAGLEGWFVSEAMISFNPVDVTSGVGAVMYRLDGGSWTELVGPQLMVTADGEHTLQYYCVDVAGNQGATGSTAFKVDATPPETTSIVDGSTVTLTAADTASGVSAIMYRIDGGAWQVYLGAFVVEGKGNHTVEYYARDVAGNNETAKSITVEGKAGGIGGLLLAVVMAVVILAAVAVMFALVRRRPPRQRQMVPGEAVVELPGPESPPPPPTG